MKSIKKVYVVGDQINYANFINNVELTNNIKLADIIIFTGGEDVDPSLYNCKKHETTYSNIYRDRQEIDEFNKIRPDQLVVGICRGSQLTCILNGGLLIQDVNNHSLQSTHKIIEFGTNKIYEITSTHHQMQYPFNLLDNCYDLLFVTPVHRSDYYEGDKISYPDVEPEIVLYHKENFPKCLAIQGHPEYMRKESLIVIRLNEIINDLLNEN